MLFIIFIDRKVLNGTTVYLWARSKPVCMKLLDYKLLLKQFVYYCSSLIETLLNSEEFFRSFVTVCLHKLEYLSGFAKCFIYRFPAIQIIAIESHGKNNVLV